jgi:hypothetical protein
MLWWEHIFEVFMIGEVYSLKVLEEVQSLSYILGLNVDISIKKESLKELGYTTDEEIIQLLIRTSLTIEELYSKLEALGYDNVNKNHIQVSESGTVCVPLPTKDFEDIPIYETIMSFNY